MSIEVIKAASLWTEFSKPGVETDKVYNVQLIKDGGMYKVEGQWGKRHNVLKQRFQGSENKITTSNLWEAEQEYQKWLRAKTKKYGNKLPSPIIPHAFKEGRTGTDVLLSKDELRKMAIQVDEFHDFLKTTASTEPEVQGFDLLASLFD